MKLDDHLHLTYCTNIHPGESWAEVEQGLKVYLPRLKASLSPDRPFGVGLRLSGRAAVELERGDQLEQLKVWLESNGLYVFTINGFPYGHFHGVALKDGVHSPDWTDSARLDYTLRLFRILAELCPVALEGGISTSPLSYRYWHSSETELKTASRQATKHMLEVVLFLHRHYQRTGQIMHLDVEPEPDGLLEDTQGTIDWYQHMVRPEARRAFGNLSIAELDLILARHLRLCYDVCHFAVEFEGQSEALERLNEAGIPIGKIQLSAALKVRPRASEAATEALLAWHEPTYLHQVVAQKADGSLDKYRDLAEAAPALRQGGYEEIRSHFHVPIFVEEYGDLSATQQDIEEVLALVGGERFGQQLEVETYTWGVLPGDMQMELGASIERELNWVIQTYRGLKSK